MNQSHIMDCAEVCKLDRWKLETFCSIYRWRNRGHHICWGKRNL